MRGYQAWRIHKAVALHLSSLKYDVFKSRGSVRGNSLDYYAKVKAKYPFEFAEAQCKDNQELAQYFVANVTYSREDGCYDLTGSWERYKLWVKHKEQMTQLVLDYLEQFDESMVSAAPNAVPTLLYEVVSGSVIPEVAAALNRHLNFVDAWLDKNYAGLHRYAVLVKKLDRFVKYNEAKVVDCLADKQAGTLV